MTQESWSQKAAWEALREKTQRPLCSGTTGGAGRDGCFGSDITSSQLTPSCRFAAPRYWRTMYILEPLLETKYSLICTIVG